MAEARPSPNPLKQPRTRLSSSYCARCIGDTFVHRRSCCFLIRLLSVIALLQCVLGINAVAAAEANAAVARTTDDYHNDSQCYDGSATFGLTRRREGLMHFRDTTMGPNSALVDTQYIQRSCDIQGYACTSTRFGVMIGIPTVAATVAIAATDHSTGACQVHGLGNGICVTRDGVTRHTRVGLLGSSTTGHGLSGASWPHSDSYYGDFAIARACKRHDARVAPDFVTIVTSIGHYHGRGGAAAEGTDRRGLTATRTCWGITDSPRASVGYAWGNAWVRGPPHRMHTLCQPAKCSVVDVGV